MALFTEGLPNENFTTFYDYDKHGNITHLTRFGQTGHNTYGIIDDLTYTYNNSNQVRNITDAGPNVTFNNSQDFKDYTKGSGIEYTYNKNGARITDLNKGISAMTYNILNLPKKMDIKSPVAEARNEYIYSANGEKLKVIQKWNPAYLLTPQIGTDINVDKLTLTKTIDYTGNKIYEDGALKLILTDNGYLDYVENKYYFYIQDHLGNNRVVTDLNLQSVQSMQYYPFGMTMGISLGQAKQPYKFGGKELDLSFGVNMSDYSARHIDLSNPMFTTIDPLAENYYSVSPYTFVLNNPVNAVDTDGRLVIFINGMHGGTGGKGEYWREGYVYFDLLAMDRLNDHNPLYRDGSVGGRTNVLNNKSAKYRHTAGYHQGFADIDGILQQVLDDNGNIKETIKVITHSMGAAYAKGYLQAMIQHMRAYGYSDEFIHKLIEFEADFAPFQPTKQKAVDGVKTYQFSNDNDNVANNPWIGSPYGPMKGAEVTTNDDPNKGHSIVDFWSQIQSLPAGNYKVENGRVVPQ
jgi:RHS repeat-associated protein